MDLWRRSCSYGIQRYGTGATSVHSTEHSDVRFLENRANYVNGGMLLTEFIHCYYKSKLTNLFIVGNPLILGRIQSDPTNRIHTIYINKSV